MAIVAPRRIGLGTPFSICAIWFDPDGAPLVGSVEAGAGGACTIEAKWNGEGTLSSVRHLRFPATVE